MTFKSESPVDSENEFHNAVDDYLEYCSEIGKNTDKSYICFCSWLYRRVYKKSLNSANFRSVDFYVSKSNAFTVL